MTYAPPESAGASFFSYSASSDDDCDDGGGVTFTMRRFPGSPGLVHESLDDLIIRGVYQPPSNICVTAVVKSTLLRSII